MQINLINSIILGLGITIIATASHALMNVASDDSKSKLSPARIVQSLKLPELSEEPERLQQPSSQSKPWLEHTIKSGENLAIIFSKLGLSKATLHRIIQTDRLTRELNSIRPGQKLKILTDTRGELVELLLEKNRLQTIVVSKSDSGFTSKKVNKQTQIEIAYAHGVIKNSLYVDAKKAGLSNKLIMQLANIFAWDIDFALSLRVGDQFTIIYNKILLNGELFDTGKILAAEFENRGISHQALLYATPGGRSEYYSPEGKSLRKAFLRSPVDFARISSRFNLRRRHPILNRIRAHKGVDYAAGTGTPVRATGDGKIVYRGRKGGYGRTVIIRHAEKYSTLYAHLSRYNSKRKTGARVKQGQIIGYVGKSGLATGPHLHYEFRVNGIHKNPLTIKLGKSKPLAKQFLADFKLSTQMLLSQLEKIRTVLVAQSE